MPNIALENAGFARDLSPPGGFRLGSGAQQESEMKFNWIVVAGLVAGLAVIAADPALARVKYKAQRQCVDRAYVFSWGGLLTNPPPRPNGCAPAVYQHGDYIGQDPDAYIRLQLRRDPRTGFTSY